MAGDKRVAIIGGLAAIGVGTFLLLKKRGISLESGWNEVTYTGSKKKAGIAMQSIEDFLEIAYYYDAFQGIWIQVVYDTILEPGQELNIKVTEDCVWTF